MYAESDLAIVQVLEEFKKHIVLYFHNHHYHQDLIPMYFQIFFPVAAHLLIENVMVKFVTLGV